MRIALVTTTIRIPTVLRRYRELDPSVVFYVIGDRKTPHDEVRALIGEVDDARYYSDADQEQLGYKCSEIIGWNKIQRRNIGVLEAAKDNFDVIVSIDDDNIPLHRTYLDDFRRIFTNGYNGLEFDSDTGWFNVGEFLHPKVFHRGFPHELRSGDPRLRSRPVSGVQVGVAAGLWLGDPDIDAVDRLVLRPNVVGVSDAVGTGIIVAKRCWSPFDSQNTAFRADLFPLMLVLAGVGRFDDIWGSYIAQRVMAETGHQVHYGPPLVWQERNEQSIWRNLQDELYGMENTLAFCEDLGKLDCDGPTVVDKLRMLYDGLRGLSYVPPIVPELGLAWCDDCETALS